MIIRRLIVPLTLAAVTACAVHANAQGAFPAPLPGQQAAPAASPFPPVNGAAAAPRNDSAFPPVNGAAPVATLGQPAAFPSGGAAPFGGGGGAPMGAPRGGGPSENCMKGFVPLREEAEKRGKLIKAASERHAQPEEACKLIKNYSAAELNMIKYVKTNTEKCGIPAEIGEQMKKGHAGTEAMMAKVCGAAEAGARGPAGPSLSEVLGSAAVLPEATTGAKKNGGTTFDTLNGNVLAR